MEPAWITIIDDEGEGIRKCRELMDLATESRYQWLFGRTMKLECPRCKQSDSTDCRGCGGKGWFSGKIVTGTGHQKIDG